MQAAGGDGRWEWLHDISAAVLWAVPNAEALAEQGALTLAFGTLEWKDAEVIQLADALPLAAE